MEVSHRNLLKMAGAAAVTAAVGNFEKKVEAVPVLKFSQAPVIGSKNVPARNTQARRRKFISQKKIGKKISSPCTKFQHC